MNFLKKSSLPLLLSALSAMVWGFAVIYSQNNLLNNKDWYPYAEKIPGLKMKAIESLVARYPVAGFRLSGGPAGFRQRVVSKENFHPEKMIISFRLKENSWLAVGFNQDGGSFEGVRFSSSNLKPSAHFQIDQDERLTFSSPLSLLIRADEDHIAVIEKIGNDVRIQVEGKDIQTIRTEFRQGPLFLEVSENATVSALVLEEKGNSHRILSFAPDLPFSQIALSLFIFFGCLVFLIHSVKFHSVILLVGLLWTSFDYFVWSKKLFQWNQREQIFIPIGGGLNAEAYRGLIFDKLATTLVKTSPLPEKYRKPFPTDRKNHCLAGTCSTENFPAEFPPGNKSLRLLIVGGSMSSGWGVSSSSRNYDEVLYHELRKTKPNLEIINFAGPDQFQSPVKISETLKLIEKYRPDFLMLELNLAAVNVEMYENFLHKAKSIVPQLIYIYSPFNGTLYPENAVLKFQELLKLPLEERVKFSYPGVAQDKIILGQVSRVGIRVIDPRNLFIDPAEQEKAFLFWDIIHLTDAGHDLLGRYLAERLKN